MKKIQKSDNKGFTLVELIVVIVILAILAAILVPALLGYIDKAKSQQVVLNAKSALTAAQADMSTIYAKSDDASKITDYKDDILDTADVKDVCEQLLIGCDAAVSTSKAHKEYTITYVKYKEKGKDAIVFDGTSWDKNNTKPSSVKAVYAIVGTDDSNAAGN